MEAVLKEILRESNATSPTSARSRQMGRVRATGNRSTEWQVRAGLIRAGIRGWKMHPQDVIGRPDFWFPDARLALFVDGCFWHGCRRCGHYPKSNSSFWRAKLDGNRNRDRRHNAALRRLGITVMRIWEHELKDRGSEVVEAIRVRLTEADAASV